MDSPYAARPEPRRSPRSSPTPRAARSWSGRTGAAGTPTSTPSGSTTRRCHGPRTDWPSPPTAGYTVSTTSGLVTTESGGTATFTVKLKTQPTANVTISISSSDLTEGTASPSSLTFTSANYGTAQTVTVTGVDDALTDGNIAYTIVTGVATSADSKYSGLNPSDVSVTNNDNDVAGFTVSPTSGLVTTEAGGTATFTIKLNLQPTANVTVGLSSSDLTEG